jgi:hypothetical protein
MGEGLEVKKLSSKDGRKRGQEIYDQETGGDRRQRRKVNKIYRKIAEK